MSRLDELIKNLCPNGVEYRILDEVTHYSKLRISATEVNTNTYVGVENLLQNKQGKTISNNVPTTGKVIRFEEGDILIGNIRPYLKKIWLSNCVGGTNGDVLVIQINNRNILNSKFLYYVLSSDRFFLYDVKNSKGAKMPRGNKQAVMKFVIPVPPLEVQREIVHILDHFTLLTAELTAELTARQKQYEYYRDKLLSFDVHGGEISECTWKTLGDIATFMYGFTDKAKDKGDTRFIRITDITNEGCLRIDGEKYITLSDDSKKYLLHKGDLLLARTGATYGKTLYVPNDEPAVYASFLIKIILDNNQILNRYYWHFSKSKLYWAQAEKLVSQGGQPHFNASAVSRIKVPLPSLAVQQRIVNILDKFDAICTDLKIGLPAEIAARQKQYEYYRDKLLDFNNLQKKG